MKDKPTKTKAAENKSDNMKITKKDIARLSGKPLTPFLSKGPQETSRSLLVYAGTGSNR